MQDCQTEAGKAALRTRKIAFLSASLPRTRLNGTAFAQLADEYQKMAHDLEALIASGNVSGDLGI